MPANNAPLPMSSSANVSFEEGLKGHPVATPGGSLSTFGRRSAHMASSLATVPYGGGGPLSQSTVRRSLIVLTIVVLGLGHVFVARIQSDRTRLVGELDNALADLQAHKEALKISRQQCNVQLKRYQSAEEKTEALLNYYREGDHSRQKDWCKKLNENALAEFRLSAQKHLRDVKDELARIVKERNELSDRIQPLALCCKSAYSKAQSLMAGASREEAVRRAGDVTRGSARMMEEPGSILKHSQRVEWHNPSSQLSGQANRRQRASKNNAARPSAASEPEPSSDVELEAQAIDENGGGASQEERRRRRA
ncbi:hypothetical protein PPROV_000942100 [Pycnococcus provasolii]|uniref:Uncharacterized protein n=1 Tax=Pycnococcus provasolii TaxID=41880 RepID=A0A830HY20_9CHLO|nr:hypothetical protein PPROV_000942100 [Pycnococcus provasolii]